MPLTVTGLLRPEECEIDEQYGIIGMGRDPKNEVDFPLAEIEVKGSSPSCRMVSRLLLLVPQLAVNSAQTQRGQGPFLFRNVAGEGKEGRGVQRLRQR